MKKTSGRNHGTIAVNVSLTLGLACLLASGATAQRTAPAAPAAAQAPTATATATTKAGTIRGTVKSGTVPLPGVAITATNTLTGKKYATTTDTNGSYAMTIPSTGRYVVRAELAAFAPSTSEVRITAEATEQTAAFTLQLASRAAATTAAAGGPGAGGGRGGQRFQRGAGATGMQLSVEGGEADVEAATIGGATPDMPSLGGLSDDTGGGAAAAGDSVAISGQQGQTNGIANMSEDQINQRIQDATNNIRQQGGNAQDQLSGLVTMFQGLGGGPGGFGGGGGAPGGGGRGGPGGGGGGRGGGGGGFRNFNPAQPHGSIFWQGGNNALDSGPWQPSLVPEANPAGYQNRFGLSIAGTPYLPNLTKPDTRQFVFINLTGQKNLNAFAPTPVRVPTLAERAGDFSQSQQVVNGALQKVTLFNPATGAALGGAGCSTATGNAIPTTNCVPTALISPAALKLLNYYPAPNINTTSTDPTVYNYQTISNAGSNNVAINGRYQRQLGQNATPQRGRGGAGGGRGQRPNQNLPPVLRQNINVQYSFSHSASDIRNIILPLGGRTASDGNSLNAGYVISYGRLSNNAALNWNRSNSATTNFFTDTANNPTATVGLTVPNQASNFADQRFYNGLPSLSFAPFAGLSNTTPSQTIGQTISFSDFVSWRHKKHNFRFGGDIRRVHSDSIGGNTPFGTYSFTGYATSKPADQVAGNGGTTSGSGFADFLLGLPESTSIQAGIYKDYLRENVYDWYATDDWRALSNVTINYSVRYEYFGPYTEKNNHLVNLDVNLGSTPGTSKVNQVVMPNQDGYPSSLVNPDHLMYAPRLGIAYSPKYKFAKGIVIRAGYGVNYNTGQYATFARLLSHQVPFSVTQNNTVAIATTTNPNPTSTGCTTTQSAYTYTAASGQQVTRPATSANLSLNVVPNGGSGSGNGFGCGTAGNITNNWAVDKNYRLGNVQIYNINIQKSIGQGIVAQVGYNGAKGSNLDTVGTPNGTINGSTIAGVQPFDYEESTSGSHSNSLVVTLQQRQRKGLALSATYTYLHAIDNASGVGGTVGTPVQNFFNLAAEEGNSTFDQRHNLNGTFLYELPVGPNRAFLNKGGIASKVLNGFSASGSFTFGSGNYYTPTYSSSQLEAQLANTATLRPDRVIGQPIVGPGKVGQYFNKAAFTAPVNVNGYGTASQGSIEGPGTVAVSAALSRTVQFGGTNSMEVRMQATNVFNTVQYSGINTTENSNNFGEVTSAAAMRALTFIARYRF